jgi:hypothetical protein
LEGTLGAEMKQSGVASLCNDNNNDSPANGRGTDEPSQPVVIPLKFDKKQRTLLSLSKVVRLDNTSVCFTGQDIERMKVELLDASKSTQELLVILRKLECYKLDVEDVLRFGIGRVVNTLAIRHPKLQVSEKAYKLVRKWKTMVYSDMFREEERYDVQAAMVAPEGTALAPQDYIEAEKEAERLKKLEKKRERIEADVLCSSTDDEIEEDEDDDWVPDTKPMRRRRRRVIEMDVHVQGEPDAGGRGKENGVDGDSCNGKNKSDDDKNRNNDKNIEPCSGRKKKEYSKSFMRLFKGKVPQDTSGETQARKDDAVDLVSDMSQQPMQVEVLSASKEEVIAV